MKRLNFLSLPGLVAGFGALVGDTRQPRVGFMDADTYPNWNIAEIHLDGHPIEYVVDLNDVEGWVRHYVVTDDARTADKLQYLEGEVEVFWRTDAA